MIARSESHQAKPTPEGQRRDSVHATQEFVKWLKTNNLLTYQQALAEEGFDDLVSFSMISEEEIAELCRTVKMKLGHRYAAFDLLLSVSHRCRCYQEENTDAC